MSTKELREQRAKLVHDARVLLEKTEPSAEDGVKFDQMMSESDTIAERIAREERALAAEEALKTPIVRKSGREAGDPEPGSDKEARAKAYSEAFHKWARFGIDDLDNDERKVLRMGWRPDGEQRAPQTSTTTGGGYTIPQDFMRELERARLTFGGVEQVARVIRTDSGAALPWPTVDDTSNVGALLAENVQVAEQIITFGVKQLDAFKYSSKAVLVPVELLQDSAFDMNTIVAAMLGERLGRIMNKHLTTGTGSGQPNGVVTASTAGKTLASNAAITFDEIADLVHSVDPAYRTGARFMFHDTTLKVLRKVKDTTNQYIWQPSVGATNPDSIWGYPYTINQDVPALADLAKVVLFGDFSKYIVRIVKDITLLRLVERYADYHQIGFFAFMRMDGELIDAGTNPIKHAVTPSGA